MSSRIDKLTAKQIARFAEFHDRWVEIGLSTAPADRPQAEAAIAEMYRTGGLPQPKKIVWCGSPLSQGLTRAIILNKSMVDSVVASVRASVGDSVGASVRASVRDSVRDSVGASVVASVRASVGDSVGASVVASVRASVGDSVGASVGVSVGVSVRDSVWASVRASVRDSVRDSVGASVVASVRASVGDSVGASVWDSVGVSVRDSVWASVRASVRDSVWASVCGQHDAGWLGFYRYFHDVCGLVDQTEKLNGLWLLAQSAGWTLPHTGICWVSERHHVLTRDGRGRLHNIAGPACAFPDGWAIYAWHGVRVPSLVIETPEKITSKMIDDEPNQEVRRVMIERYGYERYVSDGKIVHEDQTGRLIKKRNHRGDEIAVVSVVNGTKEPDGSYRRYVLSVPPEMRTACQAVAWTYGLSEKEYSKLQVRT